MLQFTKYSFVNGLGLALLMLTSTLLHAEVESGAWYDRQHNGHGLDLHRAGPLLFGLFYTYDQRGASEWLWLQSEQLDAPRSELTRFERTPSGMIGSPAGAIALTEVNECPDGFARPGARRLLRMDFHIGERAATWCIEPLLPVDRPPLAVLSGVWYAPDDSGWGLTTHAFADAAGVTQRFQTLYFHDGAGHPRWAFALNSGDALTQSQNWYMYYVECSGCPFSPPLTTPVGASVLTLTQPLVLADSLRNHFSVAVHFEDDPPFVRDAALGQLSTPLKVGAAAATAEGPVAGLTLADQIESYTRIPYARPPVADLRWRAPQQQPPRNVLLQTREFGLACAQRNLPPEQISEDCLQLNVWTPSTPGQHPVMVWIHGGDFVEGSAVQRYGENPLYDGAEFARRNIVFVSLNYRLGALGFLAQRTFIGETQTHPQAGNYGLLDQVAALQWVHDNIGAFGGDSGRVTIFGESAGASSVCALLTAPTARSLFQRAIVQSGRCLLQMPGLTTALAQADQLTSTLGCQGADPRACLRSVDTEQLLVDGDYGPIVDGSVLPESPGLAIRAGRAAAVPLLIGSNDDESTTLVASSALPTDAASYQAAINNLFPLHDAQVQQQYPLSAYPTAGRAFLDLLDDLWFSCPARRTATDHAAQGHPVFHYALTEILPDLPILESFHGLDVLLLFVTRAGAQGSERQLGELMRSAWVDFAYGREPGISARLAWPRYQAGSRQSLELNGNNLHILNDYRGAQCGFWGQFDPP